MMNIKDIQKVHASYFLTSVTTETQLTLERWYEEAVIFVAVLG